MRHKLIKLLFNSTLILIVSFSLVCLPAKALLRQHHEAENILRYHAQDSLKDLDGNTWQVILFPENLQNATTAYYLRLVGFPGLNSFIHPQSLEILTSQGQILTAIDSYQNSAPAPNVGQYNLTPIIFQIPERGSLKLSIPLAANQDLALKIPPKVLQEWQLLIKDIEKS